MVWQVIAQVAGSSKASPFTWAIAWLWGADFTISGSARASSQIFATTSIQRSMSSFDQSSPASGVKGSATIQGSWLIHQGSIP